MQIHVILLIVMLVFLSGIMPEALEEDREPKSQYEKSAHRQNVVRE